MGNENRICPQCGVILPQSSAPNRKFCSEECRKKWWSIHKNEPERKSSRTLVCACCGIEFRVNSKAERKYCSHECYINDRFKSGKPPKPSAPRQKKEKPAPVKLPNLTEEEMREHREFEAKIWEMRRNIPCTCRACGKKYLYHEGFGMKYCSEACYVANHPKCEYDPDRRILRNMKPTYEEMMDTMKYLVTMSHVFRMFEQDLITKEEYYKISFKLAEKYAPDNGTLFTDMKIYEWELEQRKKRALAEQEEKKWRSKKKKSDGGKVHKSMLQ